MNRPEHPDLAQPLRHFKPYPAYKDSGVEWIGQIPAHWDSLSLSRVTRSRCDGPFGSGLKSEHYSSDGVRVIRLQNIGWAVFDDADRAYIDQEYASTLGDHRVVSSDLLIAGLGDERHPVGRACVAPDDIGDAIVKADCFRFRLDQRRTVPQFAAYQLSATASAAAGSLATGATRARMNLTTTAARKLGLPPPEEQAVIVDVLDRETARLDALVAKKKRLIELLHEERAAVISRAVTKGLNPNAPMRDSGVEWLGEIPAHWEVKRIKNTTTKIGSGKTPLGGAEVYVPDGVMLLRSQNVHFGALRLDDVAFIDPATDLDMAGSRVLEGDVLLNITGASLGRCCVARLHGRAANVNQHVCIIRPKPDVFDPSFLEGALASRTGQAQIFTTENGISRDALNFDQIGRLVLACPPLYEQHAIAAFLDRETASIDALVAKVDDAIDHLRELRTALISAAVTGKIDVRGEAG